MSERNDILAANRRVREGVDPKRRLDCGETTFRIPDKDFFALRKLYPDLASLNGPDRFRAWQEFARSPFSEPYRVVRSPAQVRRSDARVQVR